MSSPGAKYECGCDVVVTGKDRTGWPLIEAVCPDHEKPVRKTPTTFPGRGEKTEPEETP